MSGRPEVRTHRGWRISELAAMGRLSWIAKQGGVQLSSVSLEGLLRMVDRREDAPKAQEEEEPSP